jgi:hypothetical protein
MLGSTKSLRLQATIKAAGTGNTSDHTRSLQDRALSAYDQSIVFIVYPTTLVHNAAVAHFYLVPEQNHYHSDIGVGMDRASVWCVSCTEESCQGVFQCWVKSEIGSVMITKELDLIDFYLEKQDWISHSEAPKVSRNESSIFFG